MRKIVLHLSIVLFYALLSITWTWPLLPNITTHFAGTDDIWAQVWNFWWIKYSVFERCIHPLKTDFVYFPVGVNLYFHALSLANSFAGALLQFFLPLNLSFNLVYLSTFVLSGYGCWMLVYTLTRNNPASLFAGFIFAFSPYHLLHQKHLEHLSIYGYPFLLLFLYKYYRSGRVRNLVWSALIFTLIYFLNSYYAVFSGYLVILFILWLFFTRSFPVRRIFRHFSIFFIIVFILLSPVLIPTIQESMRPGRVQIPISVPTLQSLDLISFFIPSYNNPLLRHPVFDKFYSEFTGTETVGYLGYSVIFLTALFLFRIRKRPFSTFCLIGALLFLLLAMGPVLHYRGIIRLPFESFPVIPLPQMILQNLPIVSVGRVPARALSLAMLFFSILSGIGFAYLLSTKRGKITATAVVLLAGVEFWHAPLILSSTDYPAFYSRIAAESTGQDFAVLELPFDMYFYSPGYYQSIHRGKRVGGSISDTALNKKNLDYLKNTVPLNFLTGFSEDPPDADEIDPDFFSTTRIKYLIIDLDRVPGKEWLRNRTELVRKFRGERLFHLDDRYAVYEMYR